MKFPMTLCLTFDDGLKTHYAIAAKALETRGWRGTFNVITDRLDGETPTRDQLVDLCIEGNEWNLMTWDDARDLIARGHCVYPHTATHAQMVFLEKSGGERPVEEEISKSVNRFHDETGRWPEYFCFPHNKATPFCEGLCGRMKLGIVNTDRVNFGERGADRGPDTDIRSFLLKKSSAGIRHVDIMIHGITRDTGGWMPFRDERDFEHFLDEIQSLEKESVVKVVGYQESHFTGMGLCSRMKSWRFRILSALRAVAVR